MNYQPIDKRADLTAEEFRHQYLIPRKPVVFTNLAKNWAATKKWTFDWLKENYGHLKVPLFGNEFHKTGKKYMSAQKIMKFGDYLELIENEPTNLRMFLYNLIEHAPELKKDFDLPPIIHTWNKRYYYLFFGGKGSKVNLHYDIDCSHVFHTQFQTRKKVHLFPYEQGKFLYHEPFTVKSQMNLEHPDYKKYPAFKQAEGYETTLEHGETLFMPSCFWHHMDYVEPGFGLALRAYDTPLKAVRGVLNLATHFVVDKGMNRLLGQRWHNWKGQRAKKIAERSMTVTH